MSNPFGLPLLRIESEWSARDHQQAANYYWYEAQGYNEASFQRGECDANYKPMQQMMLAGFARHQHLAAAMRKAD